jgi:tetratricopeptide (TPR) repeat protein
MLYSLFTRLAFSFLILEAAAVSAFAQMNPHQRDSVKKLIANSTDTVKIKLMNELAYDILFEDPDSAFRTAERAFNLAAEVRYIQGQLTASNIQGIYYGMRADYVNATKIFFRVLKFQERLGDKEGKAGTLSNLAKIYVEQEKYQDALNFINQAIAIDSALNSVQGVAADYTNAGVIHKRLGNSDKALRYFDQALQLKYSLKDTLDVATSLVNIAEVFNIKGKFQQGIDSTRKAIRLFDQIHNRYGKCHALLVLGKAQSEMGNFSTAIDNLQVALKIAQDDHLLEQEKEAEDLLSRAFRFAGNHDQAYEHLQKYLVLHDSLFNLEKTKMINEIQTSYETAKKEERISFLEQENLWEKKLKVIYIVVGALILIIALLVIHVMIGRNKILKKQNEISKERFRLENENNRIEQEKIKQQRQLEAIERTALLQQQERDRLEKQKLNLELDESQRVILGKTLKYEQSRELMEKLINEVSTVRRVKKLEEIDDAVDKVIQSLRAMTSQGDSWEEMKLHFEKVHPHFFANLKKEFPELTIHDLKMCAYIKMNISNKDISKLLNINPSSVLISKTRLKKKLNLGEETNLNNWILERG